MDYQLMTRCKEDIKKHCFDDNDADDDDTVDDSDYILECLVENKHMLDKKWVKLLFLQHDFWCGGFLWRGTIKKHKWPPKTLSAQISSYWNVLSPAPFIFISFQNRLDRYKNWVTFPVLSYGCVDKFLLKNNLN